MADSSKKSNKIRDIVRLQQMLKKWKKLASKNDDNSNDNNNNSNNGSTTSAPATTASKSIKFLKKTLSFSELTLANNSSSSSSSSPSAVPKGYVAVCVGEEMKRFVIPTEYLRRQVFGVLLREAEEEFGFQQEGILRFPCEVALFEKILEDNKRSSSASTSSLVELHDREVERLASVDIHDLIINYDTSYDQLSQHHPQMCRSR